MSKKILDKIENYYQEKLESFGATPLGVDWNGKESQNIRFDQLSRIIEKDDFSITDYGCGYGAYYHYLSTRFSTFSYTGFDISQKMIKAASSCINASFSQEIAELKQSDYLVASGVFNVKLDTSAQDWLDYILDSLEKFNALSNKGFSFNLLTKYSDKEYMRDHLYYADPLFLFDHCKRKLSRNIALLHDYGLYEFTILVKKDL